MIVVVGLQECRNVIDGFIIIVHNIFVRCRHVDEIIGISTLYILPDYLELEVHCVGCIWHTNSDKGKGVMYIMMDIFEY